jgi:NADP-dependent 3-hydroxy acid dehydrogenase YdfG
MRNIENETILITGASSGFGAEVARILVKEKKANVVLAARRSDKLDAIVKELGADRALALSCDVTKVADLKAAAAAGVEKFGTIDGLVNNAGIMPLSPLASGRVDEWDDMIDTNIKGVLYAIHAVLPIMLKQGKGSVVNVSSVAGLVVNPAVAVYSGTKFAVRAISEGLRVETAGKIQVTCIYPGAFSTELGNSIKDEKTLEAMRKRFSGANTPADPTHLANAIVFALSQDPSVAINEIVMRPLGAS